MKSTLIRRFCDNDAAAAAQLFYDAVHSGTAGHYDQAQRDAWAPEVPETARWRARLASQTTFVAEQNGQITGFMTLQPNGYIDLAFVAPGAVGTGVARLLYLSVKAEAARSGIPRLFAEASHLALRFFERYGWQITSEQNVTRHGVSMTNFKMCKYLASHAARTANRGTHV